MRIGINCGHTVSGQPGCGAVGYLNESDETRAVGYALMRMLKEQGNTVIDCTNDYAISVGRNLREICALANAQPLDLFLSIHFNAGKGQGTEVYTYGGADYKGYAGRIKHAVSALGFKDRGIKSGSNLYVINNTKAPAILIEVCFVDTQTDAEQYRQVGAEAVAAAICEAVTGNRVTKEELTMTQYEELKQSMADLTETVKLLAVELENLKHPMIYNYIDSNMPEWARPTIQKLADKGYLKGDGEGLNLTDDLLRILVINDRAGIYGE